MRCELYRLNIYGEGGLFQAHVDTPTSEKMFGSLVVCLPVEFEVFFFFSFSFHSFAFFSFLFFFFFLLTFPFSLLREEICL